MTSVDFHAGTQDAQGSFGFHFCLVDYWRLYSDDEQETAHSDISAKNFGVNKAASCHTFRYSFAPHC